MNVVAQITVRFETAAGLDGLEQTLEDVIWDALMEGYEISHIDVGVSEDVKFDEAD